MRVVWTRLARRDLEDVRDYLDNDRAAQKIIKLILSGVVTLLEHPFMGKAGRVNRTRELVVSGTRYIAAYRVVHDSLEILRVLHGARKWPKRM